MSQENIQALRAQMKQRGIDAYIIPSTDPHQSEYIPDCWQRRAFLTGFSGSAGDVIVTLEQAGLWTDSRYWLQAAEQLEGTTVTLFKQGVPSTPEMYQWLRDNLESGASVGMDPKLVSYDLSEKIGKVLAPKGIELKSILENLVDAIWKDRPAQPFGPVSVRGDDFAGESTANKLRRLRKKMRQIGADAHVVTTLDSIAWLFNIRGTDVRFNPVNIAYAIVTQENAKLFLSPKKTSPKLRDRLAGLLEICDYEDFESHLKNLHKTAATVLLDPETISQWATEIVARDCGLLFGRSPISILKAIKNEREIAGFQAAHERDGRAVTRFLCWLEETVPTGKVTELEAARKIEALRSEEDFYQGPSFETISAFSSHAAIVHYSVTEETNILLNSSGLYLIDSGGQYLDGTTDITRTVCLGKPTPEQKDRFTRVLRGHIALALTSFPAGTVGKQLDTVARKPLWEVGLNYGHGTGHGVGAYLNVHEGPHALSPYKCSDVSLRQGMVTSNEPGYYKEGEYGIRIENLMHVVQDAKNSSENNKFYRLENFTYCPIDLSLVDTNLLSDGEISYLNHYHRQTREKLLPQLNQQESEWLENATRAIEK